MSDSAIISKIWNLASVLRDDGAGEKVRKQLMLTADLHPILHYRTNVHHTLKKKPMTTADLAEFVLPDFGQLSSIHVYGHNRTFIFINLKH